jgi:hypothetical protein
MKKIIGLLLTVLVLSIAVPGMVMSAQAETEVTVIPKGLTYEINSNGKYQLAEDYEGYIYIGSGVTEVTVTDEVYGGTNTNTCIRVDTGRTNALELTIKDLDITARDGNAGIDFSNAGNYPHKLLISGTCNVRAIDYSGAGILVPDGAQLTIDKVDEDAELTVVGGYGAAGIGGSRGVYATAGIITIKGGTVTATGGNQAACIGGGEDGTGGIITINGGIVKTHGNRGGAGIGGGYGAAGGRLIITGGTVEAAAGTLIGGGAGIGGGGGGNGGTIEISGGTVKASGNPMASGIGGGSGASGGSITISDGTVEAEAVTYYNPSVGIYSGGSGIGGGYGGISGTILINGGTVTATGSGDGPGIGSGSWVASGTAPGTITINGGTITAKGYGGGAGIGGGLKSVAGTISITGGTIEANVNAMEGVGAGGAGIGGGYESQEGTISISGGTVTATSFSMGSGIGGGYNSSGGIITITGGTITAVSELWGAGIGGGENGSGGTITISGGTVTATSNFAGAGIGGGYNGTGGSINIDGGTVTATGGAAGIGGGQNAAGGIINISGGTVTAIGGYSNNGAYSGYGTTDGGAGIGGGQNGDGGTITISESTVIATGGQSAAGIGGGAGGSGGNIVIDDSAVITAKGDLYWTGEQADNIGMGIGGTDPGTLKDSLGADLSCLLVNTSGVGDAKIILDGIEGIEGEYLTNDQGFISILIPYSESAPYSFLASKPGYAAVKGNGVLSSRNIEVEAGLLEDTKAPVIRSFSRITERTAKITCNNFGIYGTLYMVPKTGSAYISKAALDEAAVKISIDLVGNNMTPEIDASEFDEGEYQFYLVDSAENLSIPLNKALPFELERSSGNSSSDGNSISRILKTPTLKMDTNIAVTGFSAAALDNAFRTTAVNIGGNTRIELNITKIEGAESYEIDLPAGILAGAAGKEIKIRTEPAEVILPSNMLTSEQAGNTKTVTLTVGKADTSKLSEEIREQIGSRPVIELSLKLDGKTVSWSNPDAPVVVSIPYQPTEELNNHESITVWYIDGIGNIISVPSGRYDPATGMVTFTTTHFSYYAVAYVNKNFSDLGSHIWAKKQIVVLAAKGIMSGRTEMEFEPAKAITRAEYIGALVRALEVSTKIEGNFIDVKEDNRYYNEIATAKKLKITNGTGNNSFCPEAVITRQDMLVLTERALRSLNKLSKTGTMTDLEQFTDKTQLNDYAIASIASLVAEGLIEGSSGKLNVEADTTRAEAAVFLYRIYNR